MHSFHAGPPHYVIDCKEVPEDLTRVEVSLYASAYIVPVWPADRLNEFLDNLRADLQKDKMATALILSFAANFDLNHEGVKRIPHHVRVVHLHASGKLDISLLPGDVIGEERSTDRSIEAFLVTAETAPAFKEALERHRPYVRRSLFVRQPSPRTSASTTKA